MQLNPLNIAGTQIAAGLEGDGNPLMLIAGLGGRAAFWSNQIPALAAQYQLVLHDHRGTGGSARDICTYSIAQMAADAIAVLDHFGISKADFIGHSTGGAIAQYIALNYPERMGRMILSATWCGTNVYLSSLFYIRRSILEELGPEAYLTDGQLRGFPAPIMMEKADNIDADKAARLAQFPGVEIEQRRIDAILGHDLRSEMEKIQKETMVICAADDQITPLPLSEECATRIPGARLTVLPTGGHFAPQAVPELYTPAIEAFLRGDTA